MNLSLSYKLNQIIGGSDCLLYVLKEIHIWQALLKIKKKIRKKKEERTIRDKQLALRNRALTDYKDRYGDESGRLEKGIILNTGTDCWDLMMRSDGCSLIRVITLTSDTLKDSGNMRLIMEIQRIEISKCFLHIKPHYWCMCVYNTCFNI